MPKDAVWLGSTLGFLDTAAVFFQLNHHLMGETGVNVIRLSCQYLKIKSHFINKKLQWMTEKNDWVKHRYLFGLKMDLFEAIVCGSVFRAH